ncbi:MAG: hypothetical protein RLZZ267_233 [Bacillota bacterium]|jgi:uncharacterized protein YjdB
MKWNKLSTVAKAVVIAMAVGVAAPLAPVVSDVAQSYFSGKSIYAATYANPVTGITLSKTNVQLNTGDMFILVPTIAPASASNKTVRWTSSDKSITSVVYAPGGQRIITGLKAGTATLTATTVDGSFTATCQVVVKDVDVQGVSMNKATVQLPFGGKTSLVATISPANATNKNVTWTSSNANVAVVNAYGNVSAVGKGIALITAKSVAGNFTAQTKVVVAAPPIVVKQLKPVTAKLNVRVNGKVKAAVVVLPANAANKALVYKSLNPAIAKVDAVGNVTGMKRGLATIIVTNPNSGKSTTIQIQVK